MPWFTTDVIWSNLIHSFVEDRTRPLCLPGQKPLASRAATLSRYRFFRGAQLAGLAFASEICFVRWGWLRQMKAIGSHFARR